MLVLSAGQRALIARTRPDLVEGRDFIAYDQVPPARGDLIVCGDRMIDRRTTDGEMLAADRRNAKPA